MAGVTQQSLPCEAMWGPKREHSLSTWKKQKGPKSMSQRTIVENLANTHEEVEETFSRTKPKAVVLTL